MNCLGLRKYCFVILFILMNSIGLFVYVSGYAVFNMNIIGHYVYSKIVDKPFNMNDDSQKKIQDIAVFAMTVGSVIMALEIITHDCNKKHLQ